MKEELKQIIKELSEVIEEEKLNITHSEILDSALRIYLTHTINKQKQYSPLKNEQSPREYLKDTKGLATPNQLAFLTRQNKVIPKGLTKKEAYLLIKGIKEK